MAVLSLNNLVKIYPFTKTGILFGRKKAKEAYENERNKPYVTDEGVVAVQKFSLDIEDGEFLVLLGPSGCGKSTVLHMIAGLTDVTAGEVVMDGQVINEEKPEDRDIAMIFQTYALYPHLSVYNNIAYPLKNLHTPGDEIDGRVMKMAELLNLQDVLERRPSELSGGQQQRVAIGRALIRNPKLFLMDEPLSNIDVELRKKLREELKRIHSELGGTFIYVTHDQRDAFILGDRVVVMKDGMIRQVGTPKEVYNHPADLYVAQFVGAPQINAFPAVLKKSGRGTEKEWSVELFGKRYHLPAAKCGKLTDEDQNRDVMVGIRPVHVKRAAPSESVPSPGSVQAKVVYREVIGSEMTVGLQIEETALEAVFPVVNMGEDLVSNGQTIQVAFPPDRLYVFDAESEKALIN